MKSSKMFILLATVTLCGSLMSAADSGPIPFAQYDRDGNGIITQEEFNFRKTERMTLREEEGKAMRNTEDSPNFSYFDRNGDGRIDPQELRNGQKERIQNRTEERNEVREKNMIRKEKIFPQSIGGAGAGKK